MIPAGINPSALEQAYADAMSPSLFAAISSGNPSFLHEHITFSHDLSAAISLMEEWM